MEELAPIAKSLFRYRWPTTQEPRLEWKYVVCSRAVSFWRVCASSEANYHPYVNQLLTKSSCLYETQKSSIHRNPLTYIIQAPDRNVVGLSRLVFRLSCLLATYPRILLMCLDVTSFTIRSRHRTVGLGDREVCVMLLHIVQKKPRPQ